MEMQPELQADIVRRRLHVWCGGADGGEQLVPLLLGELEWFVATSCAEQTVERPLILRALLGTLEIQLTVGHVPARHQNLGVQSHLQRFQLQLLGPVQRLGQLSPPAGQRDNEPPSCCCREIQHCSVTLALG